MSLNNYVIHYPAEIAFGPGISADLPGKLASFRKLLLVAGTHFTKTPDFEKLQASLKDFELRIETGIHAEPPLEDVDRVTASGRDFEADQFFRQKAGALRSEDDFRRIVQ